MISEKEINKLLKRCSKGASSEDIELFRANCQQIIDHYLAIEACFQGFYHLIRDDANFPSAKAYDELMKRRLFLQKVLREEDFGILLEFLCRINPDISELWFALEKTSEMIDGRRSVRKLFLQAMIAECYEPSSWYY